MSLVRPAVRVGDWEIYAYRFRWRRAARVRDLPSAVATAFRTLLGDEWTIDAVTFEGHRTIHRWTTRSEHRGQVLAQIEGSLARGDVPLRLRHATYRGELRR